MTDADMDGYGFNQQFFANQSPHLPSWSSTMPSWSSTKRHEGSLCLCASSYKQCSDSTSLRQHIVCLLASCSNIVKSNVLHNDSIPTNNGHCH